MPCRGTPYATAIRHHNEDVALLLLQRGANPGNGETIDKGRKNV